MKPLPDKKHILNSIAVIAKKLGRAPSQAEFVAQSGISKYFALRSFSSWTEAGPSSGAAPQRAQCKDRRPRAPRRLGRSCPQKRGHPPAAYVPTSGKIQSLHAGKTVRRLVVGAAGVSEICQREAGVG